MNDAGRASIIGFAGCSSLGYSLEATLAAMGAGLSNFTDAGVVNMLGTAVTAGALLAPEVSRSERLVALAGTALADLRDLLTSAELSGSAVVIGTAADLTPAEQMALRRTLATSGHADATVGWLPYGRASAFVGLANAIELLDRGDHRCVVVGGVDSLCARNTLIDLVNARRVLGPHVEGTIPGEAAAFALLVAPDDPLAALPSSVTLEAVAYQRRTSSALDVDRVPGDELSKAFRALRRDGVGRVDRVVAAHSGEGYFGRGFSHAYLREIELMPEPLQVDVTADCVGDVGAATGVLALAFGTYLISTESRPDNRRVLAYTESDSGDVGVAVIERASTAERRTHGTSQRYEVE